MLRRISHISRISRLALSLLVAALPWAGAWALPDAPVQSAPYTITGALLDQISKSSLSQAAAKAQGLANYNLALHDDQYAYALPLCFEPALVEVDGRLIPDATNLAPGDALVASVRPVAGSGRNCVERIVRQTLSRTPAGGECLQDYQVKHEVEGVPAQLIPNTDYAYQLTVYARPTLDCDGKAYGSAPITTAIASQRPFVVTLLQGRTEIKRWSLSTDAAGKVRFTYTFQAPATDYRFVLSPAVATAGDSVSWPAAVVDPLPTPSAAPAPAAGHAVSPLPIIILVVIILAAAGGAEYWHWIKQRREHELPEDEYKRVPKL
jgi:hypothetical protein